MRARPMASFCLLCISLLLYIYHGRLLYYAKYTSMILINCQKTHTLVEVAGSGHSRKRPKLIDTVSCLNLWKWLCLAIYVADLS